MKKLVSLTTAALMLAATALPVFAASPDTSTVMSTPVTLPAEVAAAEGLTAEEQAAVATTPAEAVALSATAVVEATNPANAALTAAASPATIALVKADILKNASVKAALTRYGLTGQIAASQIVARADGKSGNTTMNITPATIVRGKGVAILIYVPGERNPRVVRPRWRNGKLRVTLPLPCTYTIVQ